ncbi:MAG: hypothetical protein ABH840_02250 [Nanoarchaeota archaeon]
MTDEDIEKVRRGEATWGMISGDFRSLSGIPDNFYSAEDPRDRERLWEEYQDRMQNQRFLLHGGELRLCTKEDNERIREAKRQGIIPHNGGCGD